LATVRCPDCGEIVSVPEGAKAGDLVECPNCAGHALRLRWDGGRWAATLAYRVSCPSCDDVLTLPDEAKAGDTIDCLRASLPAHLRVPRIRGGGAVGGDDVA
jgi:ribosomal protein S27E